MIMLYYPIGKHANIVFGFLGLIHQQALTRQEAPIWSLKRSESLKKHFNVYDLEIWIESCTYVQQDDNA